jgi:site-specific DNA-methyltransferase (adenine-specific)
MIWEKDNFANALLCNKAPVSYFEDILVFSKNEDTEWRNPLREYAIKCLEFIGKPKKDVLKEIGMGDIRFFRVKQNEFASPTAKAYEKIIGTFNLDSMSGFLPYEELKAIDNEYKHKYASTFNLWEGNKYKSNILKYKKDYTGLHPTQKPILLLEDLIKTFSNEGDLVVDLTIGSGSTAIAALNTGRFFIGIEKDDKYFEIATKRVQDWHEQQSARREQMCINIKD